MCTGVVPVVPEPGTPPSLVPLTHVYRKSWDGVPGGGESFSNVGVKAMMMRILVLVAAFCAHAEAQVRISQIYGGGGNSGTVWTHDFIELVNCGSIAVDLTGWSVRYASGSGTSWQMTPLSGMIAPMHYLLVQEAPGGAGTTPLPTPDITGTIAMSASAGKVLLMSSQTPVTGGCITGPEVVDLVGFGSSATCFEGDSAAPAPGTKLALLRKGRGTIDANNNAKDFETGNPDPRTSVSAPLAVRQDSSGGRPLPDAQLRCYPSPFNSSTRLRVTVPRAGNYAVTIVNILGEEVRVLTRNHWEAGIATVVFDAGGLPSGMYFGVLQGEGVRAVGRMVLAR
jgi:hypothetical protein